MSLDCTASELRDSVVAPSQAQTHQVRTLSAHQSQTNTLSTSNIGCSHQAVMHTVSMDSISSLRDRMLFRSHPSLSLVDGRAKPPRPSVSLSSAFSNRELHRASTRNTSLPSFPSTAPALAGTEKTGRPPDFAMPASSPFTDRRQSLPTGSSLPDVNPVITQQFLSQDHPSYAINRLREKIGRGWLPPEPPYPPPPDDVPPSDQNPQVESRTTARCPHEQSSTSVSMLPVADIDGVHPESELYSEPPLVDSTTEVTTTTDIVDSGANRMDSAAVTPSLKRLVEREDGEISDDEPDSVGADLPPDSSGISSSNSHWDQFRPPSFRGFRGSGVMVFRPRFPYRGRFPRGRGFFRGRGFPTWRHWYDHPFRQQANDWGAPNDEHVVDSTGVQSPPVNTSRKQSASSRSPPRSPLSPISSSDEENSRPPRSGHHGSKSDQRSKHKSKSKHDEHPVADSTRTPVVASPEFEPSSDSDKETTSQAAASKKKVRTYNSIDCSRQ